MKSAQRLGFAEEDASRDLSGLDAADKLSVIAHTLGVVSLLPAEVQRDVLTPETIRHALASKQNGDVVRHVATLQLDAIPPIACIRLQALHPDNPLAGVRAEENAALIELDDGTREVVYGRGAGRWPTAEAVVADLLEVSRTLTPVKGTAMPARKWRQPDTAQPKQSCSV